MEAYPLLVRKRIIELFGICRSGTRRVKQQLRERGTIEPRPRTNAGRKPSDCVGFFRHCGYHAT
jgi:hypothetical protein